MAIAVVQSKSNSTASGTSLALAMTSNVTAGNLIAIAVLSFGSGSPPAPSSITDTLGNTYTNPIDETNGAFTRRCQIWYAKNIAGGANTITLNMSGTGSVAAFAWEISGLNTTAPFDQLQLATGTGTAVSSGSTPTTTDANEILVGCMWNPSAETNTPDATFTNLTQIVVGSDRFVGGTKIVSSTGTYAYTGTLNASANWIGIVGTFKTTGAGAATKLGFGQTPQGAWISGSAATTQPTVQVQDTNGTLVTTDNTTQVVCTISKGNGTLVGTTTVTCSGGIATFTNLGITQTTLADDIFQLTFSKSGGGLTAVTSSNIFVCSSTAQPAALPSVTLNTAMPTRTGALTRVAVGGMAAAISAASPGDWLVLDHTQTYEAFVLTPKVGGDAQPGGNNVIVIISDAIVDSGLLPASKRVSPSDATNMPKVRVSAANGVAIDVQTGVPNMGGYRLVGLDIAPTAGNTADMTRLTRFGDEVTLTNNGSNQPYNFVIDRCYLHGNTTQNIAHGVSLMSSYSAVIDSYIAEIHHNGADAQAIWPAQQAVGIKIENNYLEASGENVMVGNSDGIDGYPITDVTIRYNYLFKPKTWNPSDPSYNGSTWVIKNIFEIKFGRRILFEGNVLDGVWYGGQVGFAFLIKSNNNQAIPTTDVTIRYNLVRNAGGFFDLNGQLADTAPAGSFPPWMSRVNIHDNLCHDMAGSLYDPTGQVGMMLQNLEHMCDVTFEHNSSMPPRYFTSLNDAAVPYNVRLVIRNNLGSRGAIGVKAAGQTEGSVSLANVCTPNGNYTFSGNVLATSNGGGSGSTGYPAGNFFPADVASIGLVDSTLVSSGALASNSAYKGQATDGTDPGVDWNTLSSTTSLTVNGDRRVSSGGYHGRRGGHATRGGVWAA